MTDLAQSPYNHLRDRVVNGHFQPGQKIKAQDVAQEYGLATSSVREVMFRLSLVGLLDFQEQRGFRIPQSSRALQHDLTTFRILLECEGACMSIRARSVAWEAQLTAAHHKLSHIESRVHQGQSDHSVLSLWTKAEQEFHQTLIAGCGSTILRDTHDVIYHRFRQQLITVDQQFEFVPENILQHQGILDAVLSGDEDLTRTRVRAHLSRNLDPAAEPTSNTVQLESMSS